MVLLFWCSCALVAYVYIGYPMALAMYARLLRGAGDAETSGTPSEHMHPEDFASPTKSPSSASSAVTTISASSWPETTSASSATTVDPAFPPISIVIAARNEGSRLAARLENLLHLQYPAARQIVVVSDGSTDDTAAVTQRFAPAVEAVAIDGGGKAAALNAGVARARHELLVFADARQTFAADALLELARPFADPRIGAVTGELVLDGERSERRVIAADRRAASSPPRPIDRRTGADRRRTIRSTIAEGVGLYWRYEKAIRRYESAVGSTLGATGAIYAMRRALWTPLPVDTILDDVLAPMRAVMVGYRIAFNPRARAFDQVAPDGAAESRRKIRTLAGNYQILWLEPRLLLPWRNPVWVQYLSHKIGRLVVPYAMLTLMASSMALAPRSFIYAAALAAQCAFYLLAGYGAWLDARGAVATATEGDAIGLNADTTGNAGIVGRQPDTTGIRLNPDKSSTAWPTAPPAGSRRGAVNA